MPFLCLQSSIIKFIADKLTPADRFHVIVLLRSVHHYLSTGDISSFQANICYDDPMITIEKLISSIENLNLTQPIEVVTAAEKKAANISATYQHIVTSQ